MTTAVDPSDKQIHRISKLLSKGRITSELSKNKPVYFLLGSDTIKEFFLTYSNYVITNEENLLECTAIQFTRHYLTKHTFSKKIEEINDEMDQLVRIIVPQFLRLIFAHHVDFFLNSSVSNQCKMIDRSITLLDNLRSELSIQNYDSFFSEYLSKINTKPIAKFLQSDDSSIKHAVGYIITLMKYK